MKIKSTIEADFLIIGGGVAGMQAAIEAAASGLNVVVAEKADTRRSGCAGNGNDHFACYIPEYHGKNFEFVLREIAGTLESDQWQDISLLRIWLGRSFEIVKKWESYGIEMRSGDKWCFEGHTVPGQKNYYLKIKGDNIKQALTRKALDNGAKIINKLMITDLLKNNNGEICGALGIDLSEDQPQAVVFKSPAVLISTGLVSRMYPSVNPAFLFNVSSCPSVTGSGHVMALRAGARLVNMEIPALYVGPKYFQRGGRGSWIGMTSDIRGNSIGPYLEAPSREYGDILVDVWPEVFKDKYADGSGPVYMNCTRTSDEDLDYMLDCFPSEGLDSVVDYMNQYNINLKHQMIEFFSYNNDLCCRGIEISEDACSNIPGLYAAGNAVGNSRGSSTAAAVFGMIAAHNAGKYITSHQMDWNDFKQQTDDHIDKRLNDFDDIMTRGDQGGHWKEANGTLQSIMHDYAGSEICSESILKAGLNYLEQLRERSVSELGAVNSHELCRTLEVLEMMELAKTVFLTSLNRRESRSYFKRLDYPFENHCLDNKYQTIEKADGKFVLNFRNRH